MENSLSIITKLHGRLLCDSAVSLLGIYSREHEISFHAKTYTQMFMVALFGRTKNWKRCKCASLEEHWRFCGHIHLVEYLSARKRSEPRTRTTWVSKAYHEWKSPSKGVYPVGVHFMMFSGSDKTKEQHAGASSWQWDSSVSWSWWWGQESTHVIQLHTTIHSEKQG